ncbi:MAG: FecR domain-containing protein [bacterium]
MEDFNQIYKKAAEYFKSNRVLNTIDTEKFNTDNNYAKIKEKIQSTYLKDLSTKSKKATINPFLLKFKSKIFVIILTLFVIIGVSIIAYKFLINKPPVDPVAEVNEISISNFAGEIKVKTGDAEARVITKTQEKLLQGDIITTGKNAKAVIAFKSGSILRLNSNTEVTLTTIDATTKFITLTSGDVYLRRHSSDVDITIDTEKNQYATLGTAFRAINTDKIQGVEVYYSKIKFTIKTPASTKIITEGKKYYTIFAADKTKENKILDLDKATILTDAFMIYNKEEDELLGDFDEEMGFLADVKTLELTISNPADNAIIAENTVTITGTTDPTATIYINNIKVDNKAGEFSYDFKLNEGVNKIVIEAVDAANNKVSKTITVTKKPTATSTPAPVATAKPSATKVPATSTPVPTNTTAPAATNTPIPTNTTAPAATDTPVVTTP